MPTTERENAVFLTSVELLEDDDGLGEQVWAGDNLYLRRRGDVWRVHYAEDEGGDELMVYVDSIRPDAFASAQYLSRYLLHLDDTDPERVTDLPAEPEKHIDPTEY